MNPLDDIHPLIRMAETMPLDGYATGTAHDALTREADGHMVKTWTQREQIVVLSAMHLAEYVLYKRLAAATGPSIFPIGPHGKKLTVRAKEFRVRKTI